MDTFNKISLFTLKSSFLLISILVIQGQLAPFTMSAEETPSLFTSLIICFIPCAITYYLFNGFHDHLDTCIKKSSASLAEWVEDQSQKSIYISIIALAGLTLFLELVLIRWLSGLFPVFLLYKNFILLACFCGIGIGYALSQKQTKLLFASLPLLCFTIIFMLLLRYAPDRVILDLLHVPTHSALNPGAVTFYAKNLTGSIISYLPVLIFLSLTFMLNALILIPAAQYCGYLMERTERPLISYGLNLIGSIKGVVALFIISSFWCGPLVWFSISLLILLWYLSPFLKKQPTGLIYATVCIIALSWPVDQMTQYIYTPYQLIQKTSSKNGYTSFVASGYYHQNVNNYAETNLNRVKHIYNYGLWELAYRSLENVNRALIIGSGVGNDPAAALRGGAKTVDAVEIDPAIIEIGKTDHPEKPYQDERVNIIIDDGRGFLRKTKQNYDAITYGMQDTTMLLSHGSNVRFDTFVFTLEGLSDAYNRLNEGGVINILLMIKDDTNIGHKVYQMLDSLSPNDQPRVIRIDDPYPNLSWIAFILSKNKPLSITEDYLKKHYLLDVSDEFSNHADQADSKIDLPTDDWPFFLMQKKSYPLTYVTSLILILFLSTLTVKYLLPGQGFNHSLLPFFFLGAGFMLVETKAITELALVFGNTWQIIAFTITSILIMAFIANLTVSKTDKNLIFPAFIFLLITIVCGYLVVTNDIIASSNWAAKISFLTLLTVPMFFSGIIFSSLLKKSQDVTGALAYNIIGAMLGGLLEYNSLKFGFSSLYFIALLAYILAWAFSFKSPLKT
jgi:spermidine synthase